MALNPVVFTEKVVRNFLRYQLTAYPFADVRLHAQMRRLLSLDSTRTGWDMSFAHRTSNGGS